ncbi:unnamed protein product [Cochlearia groenlandica]
MVNQYGCSIAVLSRILILLLMIQLLHFETTAEARHAPAVTWSPPEYGFLCYHKINRFKNIEQDAFRPTHQGPSQGIGHKNPPGAS